MHFVHLAHAFHHAHHAFAHFLPNRAAFHQHIALAFDGITAQHIASGFFLRFHGFGAGLQDVQLAVHAVAPPFDVHRSAVVFLDGERVLCQLGDFFGAEREAFAVGFGHIHGLHRLARLHAVGKHHFDEL